MKRYQSKKHENVFAVEIERNEKFKTVMLQFDDGTTTSISTATVKRWWKLVDENYDPNATKLDENTEEVLVETADDVSDVTKEETTEAETETVEDEPIEVKTEEVPTETVEPKPKKKTAKAKKEKKAKVEDTVIDAFRNDIENTLENEFGLTKVSYAMDNVTLFRAEKNTVIRLYYGKRNLVFHVRPEIVPEGVEFKTYKYFLSAVFHKNYDNDTMDFIKSLMDYYKEN